MDTGKSSKYYTVRLNDGRYAQIPKFAVTSGIPPWMTLVEKDAFERSKAQFQRQHDQRKIGLLILIMMCLTLMLSLALIIFSSQQNSGPYKHIIDDTLLTIVENGGDLMAVKHAYNATPNASPSIVDALTFQMPEAYPEGVPLSYILDELRTSVFLNNTTTTPKPATELLPKLERLIAEHNATNPFDKLEPTQKDHFIDIMSKLDTDYVKIERQMNKVADELANKNRLVSEYLADSTTSLYVSWIGLGFALIMAVVNYFQNRRSKQEAMIGELISDEDKEREEVTGSEQTKGA